MEGNIWRPRWNDPRYAANDRQSAYREIYLNVLVCSIEFLITSDVIIPLYIAFSHGRVREGKWKPGDKTGSIVCIFKIAFQQSYTEYTVIHYNYFPSYGIVCIRECYQREY